METYDVIIVGAGPAGGQCARELAAVGKKVLLAERNRDFTVNSYSSAGAPNEIMETFQLPHTLVGSYWNKFSLHSSNTSRTWEEKDIKGVILNFEKLRTFLAKEAENASAVLKFGFFCTDYEKQIDGVIVRFKTHEGKEIQKMKAKILVDATGSERQVLAKHLKFKGNSFSSTGIEYLIEVTPEIYKKWANALSIFMGQKWMPQGYSWIFPMEPNLLKVGVGRYFQNDNYVPHEKSYTHYMHILMDKCLGSKQFPILDRHGKTIIYTYDREDLHFDDNVIAIGDSVSTINPLGFEGIRHAMFSGRIASKYIQEKLSGNRNAFENYAKELKDLLGFKWKTCETLMKVIYQEPNDKNVDLIIETFRGFSFKEIIDLAFHYKLMPAMKFLARYTFLTAKRKVKSLIS
jgi:digeranylgeranylglycerophospholipid reductase